MNWNAEHYEPKPKLIYTTERPTVPGYYWLKTFSDSELVLVISTGNGLRVQCFGLHHSRPLEPDYCGEHWKWAGPVEIERPEE